MSGEAATGIPLNFDGKYLDLQHLRIEKLHNTEELRRYSVREEDHPHVAKLQPLGYPHPKRVCSLWNWTYEVRQCRSRIPAVVVAGILERFLEETTRPPFGGIGSVFQYLADHLAS